jgi:putative tryptophan/tyrosine transport system substrate-binding protein
MKRRTFIGGLGSAVAWPVVARGQQPALPLVGWLGIGSSSDDTRETITAVKQGWAEAGLVEGRNFAFEYRFADYHPERLPGLAAELVRRRVAVMFTPNTPATLAAKAATDTIPIVFAVGIDPVAYGLVTSFTRPGGNLTGITNLVTLLAAKRLEVLHELVPSTSLIAVLANPNGPITTFETKELEAAAGGLGVRLLIVNAAGPDEFGMAFATIAQQRAGALVLSSDSLFLSHYVQLIALAARHAIPALYLFRAAPEAGGLMSYTSDLAEIGSQTGRYVGRILKGEKPADLPVQQATKVELIINLKTAKTLGITFPTALLVRADKVIE